METITIYLTSFVPHPETEGLDVDATAARMKQSLEGRLWRATGREYSVTVNTTTYGSRPTYDEDVETELERYWNDGGGPWSSDLVQIENDDD